jgi:hypothetical protein
VLCLLPLSRHLLHCRCRLAICSCSTGCMRQFELARVVFFHVATERERCSSRHMGVLLASVFVCVGWGLCVGLIRALLVVRRDGGASENSM